MMKVLPESDSNYEKQLVSLLESAKTWSVLKDYKLEITIERFMKALAHLYLDYYQQHIEEAKICALDYQELLPQLVRPIELYYLYPMDASLASADEWDDTVWERACWTRTSVEAFHEMFGQHAEKLDDEELVAFMDDQKGKVRLLKKQRPKNAPQSHWWWFADYEGKLEL